MNTKQRDNTIETKEGLLLEVRPIEPDDAHHLVDIFEHMSPESRYRRFHQSLEHPSPKRVWQEAEHIAHPESPQSKGLIAFTERLAVPVGAARYVMVDEGEAEIAVSIRDDFQGMGIGARLLQLLVQEARDSGLRKLVGTVQNDNEAMWRVIAQVPFAVSRRPEGTISYVEIDLTRPQKA